MSQFSARRAVAIALLPVATLLLASAAEAAAPRITGTPATSVTVGQTYSFMPRATDADGNRLTFSVTGKPGWASFNATTGELRGVPFGEHARVWSGIVISVSDGTSRVSLPAYSVTVRPNANKSPTISGTPGTTATVGTAYAFQPTAKDPEGRALTFSILNKPTWATFSTSTGRLSGTPTATGVTGSIMVIASDGTSSSALPTFKITIGGATSATNAAPTISGTPSANAQVGTPYGFTPSAADANRDALTFSVTNMPSWATFNTATGRLSGTPTVAGTVSGIVIRVSDGKTSTALPSFSVAVAPAASVSTTRNVTVTWLPPTQYEDGGALTTLAGYRIRYGKSASDLSQTVVVNSAGVANHMIENLATGTWYFAVTAFTTDGAESDHSEVVAKSLL